MEMICPSCEAVYDLPAELIGTLPRPVQCSACGHGWTAHSRRLSVVPAPPPEEPAPPAPPAPEPAPEDEPPRRQDPEIVRIGPADASAAPPLADAPIAGPSAVAAQINSDRARQLAEIREMVDEVRAPPAPPQQKDHSADSDATIGEIRDRKQRQAMAASPVLGAVGDDPEPPRPGRNRGHQASGSGWFVSGFLLIVIVASVMASVYLLRDVLVQQFPDLAPGLKAYVTWVDDMRRTVAMQFEGLRDWLMAQLQGAGGG